jgi:hypothetical protein
MRQSVLCRCLREVRGEMAVPGAAEAFRELGLRGEQVEGVVGAGVEVHFDGDAVGAQARRDPR